MIDKLERAQPRYLWFDFHHECRKMKYENLSKLIDSVREDFNRHGCFSVTSTGKVLSRQSGIIRTNCIDNLDRTNVVQSLFGRQSILAQFNKRSDSVLSSPFPSFEVSFKNTWADNADQLSLLYTGTGAQKTDFTRTGKRTLRGNINDGIGSVTRYYLNNFTDAEKQDGLDLFLGKYKPDPSGPVSFYAYPQGTCGPNSQFVLFRVLLALFTLLFLFLTCQLAKFRGRDHVSKPRLLAAEYDKPVVSNREVLSLEGLNSVQAHLKTK